MHNFNINFKFYVHFKLWDEYRKHILPAQAFSPLISLSRNCCCAQVHLNLFFQFTYFIMQKKYTALSLMSQTSSQMYQCFRIMELLTVANLPCSFKSDWWNISWEERKLHNRKQMHPPLIHGLFWNLAEMAYVE